MLRYVALCSFAIVFFGIAASPADAASKRIHIQHAKRHIERHDTHETIAALWDGPPDVVFLERGSTATVYVEDPNTLLYTYSAGAVVTSATADAGQVAKLTAAIKSLGISGLGADQGKTVPTIGQFKEDLRSIEGWNKKRPELVRLSLPGDPEVLKNIRQEVQAWDVGFRAERVQKALETFSEVSQACLRGETPTLDNAPIVCDAKAVDWAFIQGSLIHRTTIENAIASVRTFHALTSQLGVTMKLGQTIRYDVSNDQTLPITIALHEDNARLLASDEQRQQAAGNAGTLSLVFTPKSSISIRVGPAAVFFHESSLEARAAGNEFVIARTDDELTSAKVAAMASLSPQSWDWGSVSGKAQLGVSLIAEKPAWLVGGGVSFLDDVLTLGAGVIWRRVNVLNEGQSEGTHLPSADALRFRNKLKPAVYIAVTVMNSK